MKRYFTEIVAVVLVLLGLGLLVEQKITGTCPIFFHVEDILSHETAASLCVVAAVALVVGKFIGKHWS